MGKKKERYFRFKKFNCRHEESSMKIGVDAVLLGAWADVENVNRVLDVGAGCGIISLMLAQRIPSAIITAVEIEEKAAKEAHNNFIESPWQDRLEILQQNFLSMNESGEYDLIVSNPPYFDSGVDAGLSDRMLARHEGALSPLSLLHYGKNMLSPEGRIALILPYERSELIVSEALKEGLVPARRCDVRGRESLTPKRTLLEFVKTINTYSNFCCSNSYLVLEIENGLPTEEYRELCREFYLKF
ncbi:MAG: methyltransferase [Muribaculaceae bacterium]|nr:methyltransferase [Muribaculaceae bacterium]